MYFFAQYFVGAKNAYFDLPRANQEISYSGDLLVTTKRVSYSSFSSIAQIFFFITPNKSAAERLDPSGEFLFHLCQQNFSKVRSGL